MTTRDPDKARSRLINAVRRIIDGTRLERDRIHQTQETAPRLLEGTEYEVVNLSGVASNDLDYYAYELARLQDAARTTIEVFDSPPVVVDALKAFEAAIPSLRRVRNPLTHPSDDTRLDNFAWFSSVVNLGPAGQVEYLIDPRTHQAGVEQLGQILLDFLRQGIRDSGQIA
jgi:hypothetical protein